MKSKRLAVIAVTTALLAAAGCGGSNSGSPQAGTPGGTDASGNATPIDLPPCPIDKFKAATGPVEIVVWYELSAKTEQELKDLAAKYNASQTKVKVSVEKQGASYEELLRKYESAMQSKSLPDLIITEDTAQRFMVDSNTVLPAESCLKAENMSKDGYVKTAVDHYSVNNVLYPASANLSDILTYYNKNHFRQAGLDPEKSPGTLAEVRAAAEKIKAAGVKDKDGNPVKPVVLKLDSWLIETQLTGAKQSVVNNNNGFGTDQTTQATFDNPKTVELFKWIKDMYKDGLLDAIPATEGQVGEYLAMASQKSSITMETSTAATSVKAFLGGDTSIVPGGNTGGVDVSKLDIGAGPAFGVDGPGKAQIGGGVWYMTKTGPPEKQGASWDFMKWWNQVDNQAEWHLVGSYLPFVKAAADSPKIADFWKNDIAGQWLAIAWQELLTGVNPDFTGPLIGPYDKFRTAMRNGMDSLIFKDADPQTAVTQASTETTAALKEYNDAGF